MKEQVGRKKNPLLNTSGLSLRDRKLIKARAEGKTLKEAGKIAGMPERSAESQASQRFKDPKVQEAFTQILDRIGLTDEALAQHVLRLCGFKKTVVVRGKEEDSTADIEDGQVQLGAVKLGVQLKGHLVERVQHDASAEIMAAVAARMSGAGSEPGTKD